MVQIFITTFITVFSGTLVFVLGQIINKFFIEPIHNQSKVVGKIGYNLIFYSYIINNPGLSLDTMPQDVRQEAYQELRGLASEIMMRTYIIKGYCFFEKLKIVPRQNYISEVSSDLIGLANSILRSDIQSLKYVIEWEKDIKNKLKLKF